MDLEVVQDPPPTAGEARELAPGVRWMRVAVPLLTGHINHWALEDGADWVLVDTGAYTPEVEAAWVQLLEGPLAGRNIGRALVTHLHADHVGMAGWLAARTGCELWMSRLEYLMCRVMHGDVGREAPEAGVRFYRAAGWSEAELDGYRRRFGRYGKFIHPLPDSFRRLSDREPLLIGAHRWEVITGCGHSPEHVCLYCAELRLLISGDQVLPRISSVVPVLPTEPAANPLQDWLQSLAKLRERVPDDVLVLPSHDEPFRGLHGRIEALRQRHLVALGRLRLALEVPCRVRDLFPHLWRRPITEALLHMATGETIANLNYLLHGGEISRRRGADGVNWYQRATG